jgi:signal transduction histidine kinase
MILSTLNGRSAMALRLVGLAAILYSVFTASHNAPALSGRGLLVLILTVLCTAGWLVWTLAPQERGERPTADQVLYVVCGGLLAAACPSSAASVFAFVGCVSAGARSGLVRGLMVAFSGALALAIGTLVYDNNGLAVLAYALGFAACALGGSNIRSMRQRTEQAELLLAQTQRSHEEQLRTQQLQQQTQLARDIHDVLAHSLAGLTIQLEATSALIDNGASPEQVKQRVQRAHELAREGLNETRRAVAVLRGERAPVLTAPARAVTDQLTALAAGYHDADGNEAAYALSGDPGVLTGQLGDTVLRTVQEAITNIRKHAPGARVAIDVKADPNAVRVTVTNVGSSEAAGDLAASGGGYGLRGMRERAALTGGTFSAGPTDDGWKVELNAPRAVSPEPLDNVVEGPAR